MRPTKNTMEDSKNQQEGANANPDEFKPKSEDEIRQQVITEYDFDEIDDEERIDKLVKDKVEAQSVLSTAIKQKGNQRTDKEGYIQKMKDAGLDPETGKPLVDTKADPPPPPQGDYMTKEDYKEEKFQEQLDELDYPDELKDEVKKVAKLNNLTPKQALKDPYIEFKVEQYNDEQGIDSASLSNTPSGRVVGTKKTPIKTVKVVDEDYKSDEGRKKLLDKLDKSSNKEVFNKHAS